MELAEKLRSIVPQFLEFQGLLRSQNYSEQVIRFNIASAVRAAISSSYPVDYMNTVIDKFKNKYCIDRMLSWISQYMNMDITQVKNVLKSDFS
jgi:hypothetical protein